MRILFLPKQKSLQALKQTVYKILDKFAIPFLFFAWMAIILLFDPLIWLISDLVPPSQYNLPIFIWASGNNARYILSALSQSQAAIFGIFFTLVFILTQIQVQNKASSPYDMRKQLKSMKLNIIFFLFIVSITLDLILLNFVTSDSTIYINIFGILVLAVTCTLLLLWYMRVMIMNLFNNSIIEEVINDDSRYNLTGAKLSGITLHNYELQHKDLTMADLRGADLSRAQLLESILEMADLRGADLRGANLRGADLRKTDLRGANLEGTYLQGAHLDGIYLEGSRLKRAQMKAAYLQGDFRGADLEGAQMLSADLENVNFEEANLRGAYLGKANLRGANLERAKLHNGNLEAANFEHANLKGANLESANLMGAYLVRANLEYANLKGANLESAFLMDAKLEGANMEDPSRSGAICTWADFMVIMDNSFEKLSKT